MSSFSLVRRSLAHHWRINLSVLLGVAAATAVLTGALLVGDSMRGSLRDLVLERLGRTDHLLVVDRLFRDDLAKEVAAAKGFTAEFDFALPLILLQATMENPANDRRAAQVTTLGTDDAFWQLDSSRKYPPLKFDEIILNEPLAEELGVSQPGDDVLLRLAKPNQIPADSPLGRKVEVVNSRRLRVAAIIPATGLGRFDLRSTQATPLVALVAKETLTARSLLNRPDESNAIILAGKSVNAAASNAATKRVEDALRPTLADFGLTLEEVTLGDPQSPLLRYYNLTSDQMLIDPEVAKIALEEFRADGAQEAITYLANWVTVREGTGDGAKLARIPYSTVTAIDSTKELGPLLNDNGQPLKLSADQIVLNSWAADDLAEQGAKLVTGDRVELTFFEPESTHGDPLEQTNSFFLAKIVPLAKPGERATLATDSHFTPTVPGLTDKESIANWDPPFPYDAERVRSTPPNNQDDDYWKKYKATPKAFVSLATGKKLWSSRFGATTTIRIPARAGTSVESLRARLLQRLEPKDLGFTFRPVKRQALEASAGTTSFAGLFIGFSMFIIAAAVMLVALLFQLGIEQRASEIGLLRAVGISEKRVRWLLLQEGLLVAFFGGILGTALGVGYAWLMLAGLKTLWVAAIVAPFLSLHVEWMSLIIGLISGVFVCALAIALALRRLRRLPVRSLMAGRVEDDLGRAPSAGAVRPRSSWRQPAVIVATVLLVAAIGLFALATQLAGEAQAGAFFGGGAAVLSSLLTFVWFRLKHGSRAASSAATGWPLIQLALRNAARNPGRSTLTIGLVASATFLIVAISAFRVDPNPRGAGGFDVIAESNRPLAYDLNDKEGRSKLSISGSAEKTLSQAQFISLRMKGGDDASCLNLYRPQSPQVLGVSQQMIETLGKSKDADFAWAETAAETPEEKANPWLLLDKKFSGSDAVPVILDKATAMYSLHLFMGSGLGVEFPITDDEGRTVKYRIVGLLANSIFQGSLLISEANFKRLYPDVSGYRVLLARSTQTSPEKIVEALESSLGDFGVDATPTRARLDNLLAVQNTYLSTFQSLGALGLLLGTFGLATVQLRSVFERRSELALMRAAGFRRGRLALMVLVENFLLLAGGLIVGVVSALLAVIPHWLAGGAAIPAEDLTIYLGLVMLVGVISGLFAARAVLRAPLVAALRGN